MIIVLVIAIILLMAQTIYLLYYKSQIRDIGNQLSFIMEHNSFKFIGTQLKPKEIDSLIHRCNALLSRQRALDQQFSRKNEEMNSTIISLSHDIRTPLTSLDGYLQLALRSEQLQDKTQYVTLAQSRIQQIIKLVDELFLYTKLQNPEYSLELESVDVMDVLKRNLFHFIDDFSRAGDEPMLNLPELPVSIVGNVNAVERVFANIVGNYFIHGGGSLFIGYEDKQDTVCIHFTNLLKAGTQVNMERIFTRFYKEDPSRTVHSSGLGLSIVKSLMEKMNGDTEAECIGDTFCLKTEFMKTAKENADVREREQSAGPDY